MSLTDSHGHPEDGKSEAPQIEKGDGPDFQTGMPLTSAWRMPQTDNDVLIPNFSILNNFSIVRVL